MDNLNLSVSKREVTGKKVSELRNNGITPVHMYGPEIESSSLQCDTTILDRVITDAGTNIPVTIDVENGDQGNLCFIREVQYHPVTNKVLHVDFMKVQEGRPVRAQVPVSVEGTSLLSEQWEELYFSRYKLLRLKRFPSKYRKLLSCKRSC